MGESKEREESWATNVSTLTLTCISDLLVLGTFRTHVDSELHGEYGVSIPHDTVEGKMTHTHTTTSLSL